ncbi:MAG: BTAD domain-containing putative transcriptional regulator [Pseudomonadota bacterium]|nr:BTAD domain-containing putative transcriptional regulator [Pseudomonadota bacterium]MEE3069643.1 BTAD domain-containing putative transcriptional regulator [Pseudomonadota bacterium]
MSAELRLLGTCYAVSETAQPIQFASRREKELLAALAVDQGRPVSRDKVLDHIWGRDDFAARKALNTSLWRLRGAIREAGGDPENWINSDTDHLMLPDSNGPWVDVINLLHLEDPTCLDLADLWQLAETCQGLFLPDAQGSWLDEIRRVVEARQVRLLTALVEGFERADDTVRLRQAAERLLVIDPFEERGWQALIALYLNGGNRAQAIRLYKDLEAKLAEELGVDPSPETRALLGPIERPKTGKRLATAQKDIRAISQRIATLQGALNETLQELRTLSEQLTDA